MTMPPEMKQAAINWLLAEGQIDHAYYSTDTVLAIMRHRGVDMEESSEPSFGNIEVEGDFGRTSRIDTVFAYVTAAGPEDHDSTWMFYVPKDRWNEMLMMLMISGAVAAGAGVESDWHAKANERHLADLVQRDEREAQRQAALAARKTKVQG